MGKDRLEILTAEERLVIILRLHQGLAVDEIAARLGKSPRQVREIAMVALSRLDRADG